MELLRRYLGSNADQDDTTGVDIVEKLVERFQSATRTEDRRDALRTLKAMSKKYRLEVGTKAMPTFIEALQNDREDADSVCYSLEALHHLMCDEENDQFNSIDLLNVPADLGSQFTEIFIKQSNNISLVLEFVDTYELHIRRNALRLLTVILVNQLKESQKMILQCPRAVSKLVDLLSDPREALRNDIIRTLVSPRNKAQDNLHYQTVMYKCGLLAKLCSIIMANGVPADVLTKAIYAVADIIRACSPNQDYLAQVIAPSEPPQPVIMILLVSIVNERQSLAVRSAALYCFQSYVMSNSQTQSSVVMSLLPKSMDVNVPISMGQLLCGGIFSKNELSTWFSSIALLHCVFDNVRMKEELLLVHLASPEANDAPPVSLLQRSFVWFQQSTRFESKIGLLQFLCTWLAYCPAAVRCFLSSDDPTSTGKAAITTTPSSRPATHGTNLSKLIAESAAPGNDESDALVRGLTTLLTCLCVLFNPGDVVGFDKNSLLNTLRRRMGMDVILEQLSEVSKSESFTAASKQPELKSQTSLGLVFDYKFTQLFKRLEYEVMHAFEPFIGSTTTDRRDLPPLNASLVSDYEQKISQKDAELDDLRSRCRTLELQSATQSREVPPPHPPQSFNGGAGADSMVPRGEYLKLHEEYSEALRRIQLLEAQLNQSTQHSRTLQSEQEDLLVLLHDENMKVRQLKQTIRQLGGVIEDESDEETNANNQPSAPNIFVPQPLSNNPRSEPGAQPINYMATIPINSQGQSHIAPPLMPVDPTQYHAV